MLRILRASIVTKTRIVTSRPVFAELRLFSSIEPFVEVRPCCGRQTGSHASKTGHCQVQVFCGEERKSNEGESFGSESVFISTRAASNNMILIKHQRRGTAQEIHDDYVAAMWLLYLRCPGRDTRDETGAYQLGEIGSAAEKSWTRPTPYRPVRVHCPETRPQDNSQRI
jgi:hypothetical protein